MNPAPPVTNTRSPTGRRLRGGTDRLRVALAIAAATALLVAGCGGGSSSTASGPRRAAEPAESPPLKARPSGPSVAVGTEPEGLAWDEKDDLIAVGVRRPAQVVFVDPGTLRVVDRVPLPAPPRHLAYDPAAGTILVPAEAANELVAVRPGKVVYSTKVGTHPHDATAVGGNVFVADEHSDQMTVLRGGRVVKTLQTPHQPGGIAGVAERWVALVAVSARVLEVYGVHPPRPLAELPAGVGPSHVASGPRYTYVADTQGDQILVYEIGSHSRLLGKAAAPGTPYGLAIDPARSRLWVTDTATNLLTEYSIDGELPRRLATHPTLRQPNSVAVDERTGQVFVTGRDSGRLERIVPRKEGR